jgi:NDP-hexose-3-ketoreductase
MPVAQRLDQPSHPRHNCTLVKIVGVAVLGVGSHAIRKALPALAASDGMRIVGICTRNESIREEQATRWKAKAYASAWAMLEDSEVDVVYVAVPTGLHATWAKEILSARKHLWCEKSLTCREEDWVAVLAQARRNDLALCECFAFPHHEQFCRLQSLLFGGEIGGVCGISARFGFPHMSPNNIRYSEPLGGGALYDAGCYPVAAARLILGRKPSQVCAIVERQDGFQVDTSGSALLRYCDGVHAHLEWGFGRAYRNEIEVWGQSGSVTIEPAFTKPPNVAAKLIVRASGQIIHEETFAEGNQFATMFSSFRRAVCEAEQREHFWNQADEQRELLFSVWREAHTARQVPIPRIAAELEMACA